MVVFHAEPPALVARDAHPAQVQIRALGTRQIHGGILVIAAAKHGMDGDDARAEDFFPPVHILEEQIERLHALAHPSASTAFHSSCLKICGSRSQIHGRCSPPATKSNVTPISRSVASMRSSRLRKIRRALGVKKMEQLLVAGPGRIGPAVDLVPANPLRLLPPYCFCTRLDHAETISAVGGKCKRNFKLNATQTRRPGSI